MIRPREGREAIPEDLRPPRSWPIAAAIVIACVALFIGYRNGSATERVASRQDTSEQRIDVSYDIRCRTQRARLELPAETEIDSFLKDLAEETFPRDCPAG